MLTTIDRLQEVVRICHIIFKTGEVFVLLFSSYYLG